MTVSLAHYLTLGAFVFATGAVGLVLNRRNVIMMLMSIELLPLAVNITLVAFSAWRGEPAGQVFALFVLTVAAAEAAVGLAILIVCFRVRGSIAVDDMAELKG